MLGSSQSAPAVKEAEGEKEEEFAAPKKVYFWNAGHQGCLLMHKIQACMWLQQHALHTACVHEDHHRTGRSRKG